MTHIHSNIKTYIDESGNSGKNLLDKKQPFFTLGAILIDDSKLPAIERKLSSIPDNLKNEKGEIKGNNIISYNKNLALELITHYIPKHSNMFFFNILEKKFMIAGQIVENFFDYVYNENTDVSWSYKTDIKIKLANFFYDNLSEKTLANAHEAFLLNNINKMTSVFHEIIREIKDIKYDFDVVSIMKGAEHKLPELLEMLNEINKKNSLTKGIPSYTISTPNITLFFEIIGRIERYLIENKLTSKIIFDNSEQYNIIYKDILTRQNNTQRKEVLISETESILIGFENLKEFEVKDSIKSIGLQLVDILSSIINYAFTKILSKNKSELSEEDIKLVDFICSQSINGHGYWVISDAYYKKIKAIRMNNI